MSVDEKHNHLTNAYNGVKGQIEKFINDDLVKCLEKCTVQDNNRFGIHSFFFDFLRSIDWTVCSRYYNILHHEFKHLDKYILFVDMCDGKIHRLENEK